MTTTLTPAEIVALRDLLAGADDLDLQLREAALDDDLRATLDRHLSTFREAIRSPLLKAEQALIRASLAPRPAPVCPHCLHEVDASQRQTGDRVYHPVCAKWYRVEHLANGATVLHASIRPALRHSKRST